MIKDTIIKFVVFAAGAAAGSLVTCKILKDKYEEDINRELDELRAHYKKLNEIQQKKIDEIVQDRKEEEEDTENKDVKVAEVRNQKENPNLFEYQSVLSNLGYKNKPEDNEDEEEDEDVEKPYVIRPDEFRMFDDYDDIYLTYYEDEYLADDDDVLVDDVENTVGWDSIKRIGEYEDDIIHVRNDALKADFEIVSVSEKYEDVIHEE